MQAQIGGWTLSIERTPYTAHDLIDKYDDLSPQWDKTLTRLGFDKAYSGLFTQLATEGELDTLPTNARVFDAGMGTGALSYAMAQQSQIALDLHGLDISSKMLDQAHQNLTQLNQNATLHTGDARQLPYENNYFDWVMTAHMLEHFDDPCVGLRELVRITKSGGDVMVIMTRKSLLGQYIDMQWRLNRVSEYTLIQWMANLGLTHIRQKYFARPVWCNWMSMVFIGTKA